MAVAFESFLTVTGEASNGVFTDGIFVADILCTLIHIIAGLCTGIVTYCTPGTEAFVIPWGIFTCCV